VHTGEGGDDPRRARRINCFAGRETDVLAPAGRYRIKREALTRGSSS